MPKLTLTVYDGSMFFVAALGITLEKYPTLKNADGITLLFYIIPCSFKDKLKEKKVAILAPSPHAI